MRVLVAPVGKSDPHGKADQLTGERTEGSVLQLARCLGPGAVVLLPTEGGDNTVAEADETRDWLTDDLGIPDVVVRPVLVSRPQDYNEAFAAFLPALQEASADNGRECCVNVSSGTPAIKAACLLALAEGLIRGEAWYADDPTKVGHAVRRVDVGVFRASALRQRVAASIEGVHFRDAHAACAELAAASADGRAKSVSEGWASWLKGLAAWDERAYRDADASLRDASRCVALVANAECAALLTGHRTYLSRRSEPWWPARDLHAMASRLLCQGRHALALEWAWVSVEACLQGNRGDSDLWARMAQCAPPERAGLRFYGSWFARGAPVGATMRLRKARNDAIHDGLVVSHEQATETLHLAADFHADVLPAGYPPHPLSPDLLKPLAAGFCSSLVLG